MTNENIETLKLFNEATEAIKSFMTIKYDFEKLEAYLTVFDAIPLAEKASLIEYLVRMIWGYSDDKSKGIRKKSINNLRNAVNKYQEAIRELHNDDVADEVKYRNGVEYSYNGEYDFDDDFDIELYLEHLSSPLKSNYLTNIELLKEIELFDEKMEELLLVPPLLGLKKPSMDIRNRFFESYRSDFKIIDPFEFIETFRPSKEHIKKVLYEIAEQHNLNKYEIKQLVDSI